MTDNQSGIVHPDREIAYTSSMHCDMYKEAESECLCIMMYISSSWFNDFSEWELSWEGANMLLKERTVSVSFMPHLLASPLLWH